MNRRTPSRQAPSARPRRALALSPIAAAASLLVLGTATAQAQQAAEPTQRVEVTGIRRAIENSVAIKREADGVVEAVSAEDLGKLPDISITESLARLPGLATQRVVGRAQAIAIRGMAPDFAGTLLNGREQVTTGDNRGVEFDQFPSELINGATVYKTPDASLIGQGVSGTIDLKSVRPLAFGSRAITLNARAERNSNGQLNANTSLTGSRFSASYVDQFADRTVGVALGFAHLDTPVQELHYKAWGFQVPNPNSDCVNHPEWGCSPATGIPAGTTYLNGFESEAVSRSQKRDGAMAVLEYKPNKQLHSVVDLYYSKFKQRETMRGLMGGLTENWNGVPGAVYSNVQTTQLGNAPFVTGATIANGNMVVRNDLNTRDDELKSAGWNLKYKFDERTTGILDASLSRAERSENVIETYAGSKTLATFDARIPTGAGFPTFTPTNINYGDAAAIMLMDPAGWGHDGLWKKPKAKDEIKALRLEGKHDMEGWLSSLDVGLHYSRREKDREMNEIAANLKNGRAPVLVPGNLLQSPSSLGFTGTGNVLAYDVMGALNSLYDLVPQAEGEIINRNYEVFEKVTTAYVKAGLDQALGDGVHLRGNFGVQLVHTDQSSHGYVRAGSVVGENTRGAKYDDILPSVNLNFELPEDQYVRAGIARTLSRGRLDDMRAGAEASVDPNSRKWSGKGGNPELEPWRANSFDLSYEKYFGKRSYVAVAGFYKKLLTYIYKQTTDFDFTGVPNLTGVQPASNIGTFERPLNGKGGSLHGVELSAAGEGRLVSELLDGYGAIGSVSYTESSVRPEGPGTKRRLAGLSRVVANLTVYYEKNGWNARIAQRYRSPYVGEVSGLHNAREFPELQADRQTDLQFGYEFQTGPAKGLSLLLQVNNATNAPFSSFQNSTINGGVTAPQEYNTFGRQYLFGISYKL